MKRISLSAVVAVSLLSFVLVLQHNSALLAQAQALLMGSFGGVAKVVTTDASGNLNVAIAGGGATFTSPGLFADGTAANPSVGSSAAPTTGMDFQTGNLFLGVGGTHRVLVLSSGIQLASTEGLMFASGAVNSATDTTISRAGVGEVGFTSVTFAALGTPANGSLTYCSDCTETTPATCPVTQASCICTGSGSGAFARRVNGAWYCTF